MTITDEPEVDYVEATHTLPDGSVHRRRMPRPSGGRSWRGRTFYPGHAPFGEGLSLVFERGSDRPKRSRFGGWVFTVAEAPGQSFAWEPVSGSRWAVTNVDSTSKPEMERRRPTTLAGWLELGPLADPDWEMERRSVIANARSLGLLPPLPEPVPAEPDVGPDDPLASDHHRRRMEGLARLASTVDDGWGRKGASADPDRTPSGADFVAGGAA